MAEYSEEESDSDDSRLIIDESATFDLHSDDEDNRFFLKQEAGSSSQIGGVTSPCANPISGQSHQSSQRGASVFAQPWQVSPQGQLVPDIGSFQKCMEHDGFFCSFCSEQFRFKIALLEHQMMHQINPEAISTTEKKSNRKKRGVADAAKKPVANKVPMKQANRFKGHLPYKFECPYCKRTFQWKAKIRSHLCKLHKVIEVLVCDQCYKVTCDAKSLKSQNGLCFECENESK